MTRPGQRPGAELRARDGLAALGWADRGCSLTVLSTSEVQTTGVVHRGRRYIMKQYAEPTCVARLARIAHVLDVLAETEVSAPRVVAGPVSWSSAGRRAGWVILSEHVDGRPLARLTLGELAGVGAATAGLHGALRDVDPGELAGGHQACTVTGCRAPSVGSDPAADTRRQLTHGDLHLGNLVLVDGGLGFFDFDEMRFGDRRHDVAALVAVPSIRDQPGCAEAVVRGYAEVEGEGQGWIDDPALLGAIGARFHYLAAAQDEVRARPALTALAVDATQRAAQGAGLRSWLRRRTAG